MGHPPPHHLRTRSVLSDRPGTRSIPCGSGLRGMNTSPVWKRRLRLAWIPIQPISTIRSHLQPETDPHLWPSGTDPSGILVQEWKEGRIQTWAAERGLTHFLSSSSLFLLFPIKPATSGSHLSVIEGRGAHVHLRQTYRGEAVLDQLHVAQGGK